MTKNSSPWLHQLKNTREPRGLSQDLKTEIAIVGAGIAGMSTAFFVLKYTTKKVTIVEASRVAHGATGHNAGQIVSYFEHPFAHLADTYGLGLAAKGQEAIFYAWDLLDEMYADFQLTTPLAKFTGYAGCRTVEQIIDHLENIRFQRAAGLDIEGVLIANIPSVVEEIPEEYSNIYARVDPGYILNLLETDNKEYIGALASRKGCLNSALFCEELLEKMLAKYPDRLSVYEHSPMEKVTIKRRTAHLRVNGHLILADRIVLCTNGFQNFSISTPKGEEIDALFHNAVIGKVGYMAAYFEHDTRAPKAISYFAAPNNQTGDMTAPVPLDAKDPYYYLTRRRFEHKTLGEGNLISVGGPEDDLENHSTYRPHELEYPERAEREITDFLRTTFRPAPEKLDYLFTWHGLMGYTKNGLRFIGPDPRHKALLYNLGCNGVGILSSIYGGKRIADFLIHHKLERSIFDPVLE